MKKDLDIIIGFLHEIGIDVAEERLSDATFLPGLDLRGATIVMDSEQLKFPGDMLHEAGHIAVTDALQRPYIGTDKMEAGWPTMGDEIATILWSYAAAHHLNLDLSLVFHEQGYKGASDWHIEQFNSGIYPGLPYLEWMGLCTKEEFPKMRRWLR